MHRAPADDISSSLKEPLRIALGYVTIAYMRIVLGAVRASTDNLPYYCL